ncbi:MAG: FixH family protein [Devosia sp.]
MNPVETSPVAAGKPFTGRHFLIVIVTFFAVVFAVNIGLAVLSSRTWTGLVVDNSYVASQEFQERLDAHRAQQALGWQGHLDYEGGDVRLVVRDGAGKPVDLGEVAVLINRPVGGHDDHQLTLTRTESGDYVASVVLDSGVWEVNVTAEKTTAGPFDLHERISVKAE